jgi:hypothetical protein
MAFVGIGIHNLDLAFLYIDEAIHRGTGSRQKRTCGVARDLARGTQGLNVRRGQRDTLHLA